MNKTLHLCTILIIFIAMLFTVLLLMASCDADPPFDEEVMFFCYRDLAKEQPANARLELWQEKQYDENHECWFNMYLLIEPQGHVYLVSVQYFNDINNWHSCDVEEELL